MRQFGLFAFLIYFIDSLAQRTLFVAGIIERTIFFIISQKIFHFELTVSNLFNQVTSHAIPIEMTVTVTFAKHAEIFGIELDVIENILLYVIRRFITEH